MKSIAFSGLDGIGKTQQISLLKLDGNDVFHFTNPLIEYDERWPDYTGTRRAQWWFEDVSPETFVDIVLTSLLKRSEDKVHGKISIHDRSLNMFKAVVAATLLTKGVQNEDTVVSFVNSSFEQVPGEDKELVLVPSHAYKASIKPYLEKANVVTEIFSEESEVRYQRYQTFLEKMLEVFVYPAAQALIVDASIVDIQNQIRGLLNDSLDLTLLPLLTSNTQIIALGGLSECGKSSFANHFRENHGFFRLKQKYFYELVKSRYGIIKPGLVVLEMLRFFQAHIVSGKFTLESLHDPAVPAMLKLFFGSRAKVVFIDTSYEVRIQRCAAEVGCGIQRAKQLVDEKDALKISRGAELVRDIADYVISNDIGSFIENSETILV